jgi:Fic family protein
LQSVRASALPLLLVDALFSSPAITLGLAEKMLGVTPRAAQLNIEKLIRVGILREATGKQRNRIYVASGIIQVVERPNVS